MSKKEDYYSLLDVQKNASKEDLKKAYRKKAMLYHPDKNPGDQSAEAKFKEINEAYEVLNDEQKRAAYDRFGHQAFSNGGGGGAGGFGGGGFHESSGFGDIFGDIFEDLMGGRSGGHAKVNTRGSDLRYNISITLDEAFEGKKTKIKFKTAMPCGTCKSTGSKSSKRMQQCNACGGRGKIRQQQGFFAIEKTCNHCNGIGQIISDPCNTCHGQGRVVGEKSLLVTVPSGVEEGSRIRLNGEGESGIRGGAPGDLYIFISVKEHAMFMREGSTLHIKMPLKMTTAILGGAIDVPIIDGKIAKITIPEGTQTGSKFRLKDKGMYKMQSKIRGDMYVHVNIETPIKLNKKQKELLEELDKTFEGGSSPESESFFKKVKDLF